MTIITSLDDFTAHGLLVRVRMLREGSVAILGMEAGVMFTLTIWIVTFGTAARRTIPASQCISCDSKKCYLYKLNF